MKHENLVVSYELITKGKWPSRLPLKSVCAAP